MSVGCLEKRQSVKIKYLPRDINPILHFSIAIIILDVKETNRT